MLLADTVSCHHLEHSTCGTEETSESAGNIGDTDKLEDLNQLLTSETTTIKFRDATPERSRLSNCQDVHSDRMARKPHRFKVDSYSILPHPRWTSNPRRPCVPRRPAGNSWVPEKTDTKRTPLSTSRTRIHTSEGKRNHLLAASEPRIEGLHFTM